MGKFSVLNFQFSNNDQFTELQLKNWGIENSLEIGNLKLEIVLPGGQK